uniref:AAA-ATPase-like domain-containing protein n=1 Tax=Desulfatirhabdium butyrativorans TaxID=340467 RepID=A0A7C4RNE6_9BACT
MKKLPIGIQYFGNIRSRENDYYYIDKTDHIVDLVRHGKFLFLSRPRRFGKSLLLSTMEEAFLGNRELFRGLYLEDHWDWDRQHPVIHISFGSGVIRDVTELRVVFEDMLDRILERQGIVLKGKAIRSRFMELIERLSDRDGAPVVVLVDEYDKPILDNIDKPAVATDIRDELKNIYSVIKDADRYLKFVFITGVSKFSKVSLFSGLNNLQDITLHERYATICGYTHEEMVTTFAERLSGVDIDAVRRWYNGYNFLGEPVYNPFDILLFLDTKDFRSYWFETGSPSFLIKLIEERHYPVPNLEKVLSSEQMLGAFDVDRIDLEPLLFQTGYLTIRSRESIGSKIGYRMRFPNLEVKLSLTDAILDRLSGAPAVKENNQYRLYRCLEDADIDGLRDIFHAFFASIPNEWYASSRVAAYEAFYASVFYCYFTAIGLDVRVEDSTNIGRIDMAVIHGGRVYLFEFKVVELDTSPQKAIEQIRSRRYWEKYVGKGEIVLVGVEFSKTARNIVGYDWERIDSGSRESSNDHEQGR